MRWSLKEAQGEAAGFGTHPTDGGIQVGLITAHENVDPTAQADNSHPIVLAITEFFSVASPASLLLFVPAWLASVSAPCPYPSCLYLPWRTFLFLQFNTFCPKGFRYPRDGRFFSARRHSHIPRGLCHLALSEFC